MVRISVMDPSGEGKTFGHRRAVDTDMPAGEVIG
jgi:hypothetical protein